MAVAGAALAATSVESANVVGYQAFNGYGNFTYDGFVWDPKDHKFVRVENYGEIFDPQLHSLENKIVGLFRLDNDLTISVYEWQNGKLVLVEQRDEQWPTGEEGE